MCVGNAIPHLSEDNSSYLWKAKDSGNNHFVRAHRVAYYLSTGELPRYLRNLCGNPSCCKASHWWKPKPRKAKRGRVRRLPASDIEHIRLLAFLSGDDDEIGRVFGLTKRQVAQIAMGKLRPEVGGRIRSSRFRGIRDYHDEFEQELLSNPTR
jgi:hypothetical protein